MLHSSTPVPVFGGKPAEEIGARGQVTSTANFQDSVVHIIMSPEVAILVLEKSIVLKQGLHYGACRALAPMCLGSWESSLANDRTGTASLVLLSSDLDVGCRRAGSVVFGTGGR